MTDGPLAFLRASLDAAEARAETATARAWSGHWEYDHMAHEVRDLNNAGTLAVVPHPEIGEHIETTDPAAVLRRIAADRAQLELHAAVPDHGRFSERERECADFGCDGDHPEPPVCRSCRNHAGDPTEAPCRTVEILAEGWGWSGRTVAPAADQ